MRCVRHKLLLSYEKTLIYGAHCRKKNTEGCNVHPSTNPPHNLCGRNPETECSEPGPHVDDSKTKRDYSHLRQTAGSLVDIVLDSVKNLGSNLPGIGAIDIVKLIKERILVRESRLFRLNTSAEIRLQTEASNRVTTEEISLYLRRLCDAAESATSSSPAYSLDQSAVVEFVLWTLYYLVCILTDHLGNFRSFLATWRLRGGGSTLIAR